MSSKSSPTSKAASRAAKAAELRREQERAEKRRRLLMIGGVGGLFLVIVVAAIVWGIVSSKVDAPGVGSDYGLVIGEDDAPHEVIIYEDFLCPLCGQLEAASHEGLAKAAADGKVRVEYRPIVILTRFGDYSLRAANAFKVVLDEAGADAAKKFHDELYADQPAEDEPDTHYTDDELVQLAVEAGADEADVRPGIEDLSQQQWAQDATDAAEKANVQGTPTILLDGKVFDDGSSWTDIGDNLVKAVQ